MIISNVYNTKVAMDGYKTKEDNTKETNKEQSSKGVYQELGVDTFEKSNNDDSVETYKPAVKKKLSADEITALKDEKKNNELELIKKFIQDTVNKQNNISSNLSESSSDLLKSVFGSLDKAYPPIATTPEDAKKAISEGGAYSVEAVSDRIMKLAKAIAGDDPDKIEKMRTAVEKGFSSAGLEFESKTNSKLPKICEDTHTEIMKRFDEWEKEVSDNNANNNVN